MLQVLFIDINKKLKSIVEATKSKIETGASIDILDKERGRPIIYLLSGLKRRPTVRRKEKKIVPLTCLHWRNRAGRAILNPSNYEKFAWPS